MLKHPPLHPLPTEYALRLAEACDEARRQNLEYDMDVERFVLPLVIPHDPAADLFLGLYDGNAPQIFDGVLARLRDHARGAWALLARSPTDFIAMMATGERGVHLFDEDFGRPPHYEKLVKLLQTYEVRRVFFADNF